MKTVSLTKVNIVRGSMFAVILLLTLMLTFTFTAKPTYAAELSGDYTLDPNYTDITELPDQFEPTTFELYKIGHFVSGPPYAELDPAYAELPIGPLPLDRDGKGEVEWTKECLAYANTLSNLIPADAVPIEIEVDENGHFSKSGLENAIYLLKGKSQLIHDYPEPGKSSYWWPQPMLVSILNNDVQLGVKPMTELVSHLMVHKVWANENGKQKTVRPGSVVVKIYYGTKDEAGLRYTVVLNESNNWCFSWDSEKGEGDPSKWMVEEVKGDNSADNEKLKHYKVSIGTSFVKDEKGDKAVVTITNTYCPSPNSNPNKTGDTFNYTKYIILMAAALLALILILITRRRRRD